MPTVLLARHAQGSATGADYDVLSELGHRQAASLADHVSARTDTIDRVVSGTLARQRDTALAVCAKLDLDLELDPRWDEYDTDELLDRYGGADAAPPDFQRVVERALTEWVADESGSYAWSAFESGVAAALDALSGALSSGETALVCTSAGPIAATCMRLLGLGGSALVTFNRPLLNASVTKIVSGRRGSTLISFNEHAYLEHDGHSLITYR